MARLAALAAAGALASAAAKPNIVLVFTDDQDVELGGLDNMPKLRRLIAEEGTAYERMYANVPVCCPSRSGLYTGRYQHNSHVTGNSIAANCSSTWWQQARETDTFAVALQAAGYSTAFAGKYLNCYGQPAVGGLAHVPPGWTSWLGLRGNSVYYNYELSRNGTEEDHGAEYDVDYLPNVIKNETLNFLDARAADGTPFLAVLSLPACHGPADPAPQYADALPGAMAPRTPAYNAKVPDTHWLQRVQGESGPLDANAQAFGDLVYRRRHQTLLTVDDVVEAVVGKLRDSGLLDNTYVLYSTDNGYHVGTFGIEYDKRQAWETDTHLPLLVRGPGIPKNATSDVLVSMPDLAATFLDMAGLPPHPSFDGTSFLRKGAGARLATLVEYVGEGGGGGNKATCPNTYFDNDMSCNVDTNYTVPPFWYGTPVCTCQDSTNNTYSCLRMRNATLNARFCTYALDDQVKVEYFDYAADPYELTNLASKLSPAYAAELGARLLAATSCDTAAACEPILAQPLAAAPPSASVVADAMAATAAYMARASGAVVAAALSVLQ